ncbi:Dihydrofolate reductase [Amphibacillus marinus]|uniref:Dihydrofolate reductase n=1 Tax=Amphibacillus marinus TaxID=872970 RepID=A0A1H8KH65_9BACI|nr:dihydrofolate reductase family protein [Amphibacillus marinus]SEN92299.1 Dihydrofolate reductase [Amphibacillus marinus]
MKRKKQVVLFIATSLDGYIATKHESLEWLFNVEGEGDNGIAAFMSRIDTILMGRRTYDWVINEADTFPYQEQAVYVFTQSNMCDTENVQVVKQEIASFVKGLQDEKGKDIWLLGGGKLVSTFIELNLIDEIIITVAPVLLGEGIPLFRAGNLPLNLKLRGVQTFNQFTELHYRVIK